VRPISLAEGGESSASSWSYSENWTTPPASGNRTSVIVSIDAEIAPHTSDWQRDCGRFAADRDLYGITERGERGLRYQFDVIERHGLKAVVFLEALSAGVLGARLAHGSGAPSSETRSRGRPSHPHRMARVTLEDTASAGA